MSASSSSSPVSPRKDNSFSGLLSRFSSAASTSSSPTSVRPRSSTTSSIRHASDTTLPNARDRLQSILDSSKYHATPSHRRPSMSAKVELANHRSISNPISSAAADLYGDAGPYAATEPSVYLDLLKSGSSLSNELKCQYAHCLADSVRIYSDIDPLAAWTLVSHLILPSEHVTVRVAALQLLTACISSYAPSQLSALDKQTFYSFALDYTIDLTQCTDEEIGALTQVLAALCRGGREIAGLEGLIEELCEYAGEMFKRRQAKRDTLREDFFKRNKNLSRATLQTAAEMKRLSPLQDHTFAAAFVAWPPEKTLSEDDPAVGSIYLLTNIHKFSWPHLDEEEVIFATSYLVTEGLATSNDSVVALIIDHIDVMSRFGYVPPRQIEQVIYFLARVVSHDQRGRTIVYSDDQGRDVEPHLVPFDSRLCTKAKTVVKNLLRSSANQALRCLRRGLETIDNSESEADRDIQVVIGCLRCLRDVLADIRSSPSYQPAEIVNVSSTFFNSWPILLAMGLPFLYEDLRNALEWQEYEVSEEVLLLLFDRLTTSSTPVSNPQLTKSEQLDFVEASSTSLTFDEWDLTFDLLERILPLIRRYEEEESRLWILDLTSALTNDEEHTRIQASISASAPFLDVLRRILVLILTAYYAGKFNGPLDRFFGLFFALEPNLSDNTAVMLLDGYQKENISLPTNTEWLDDLTELTAAFLQTPASMVESTSSSTSDLVIQHRKSRSAATYRALVLLADTLEICSNFDQFKKPLIDRIILPAARHLLSKLPLHPDLHMSLAALIKKIGSDSIAALAEDFANEEEYKHEELRRMLLAQVHHQASRHAPLSHAHLLKSERYLEGSLFSLRCLIDLFQTSMAAPTCKAACFALQLFRDFLGILDCGDVYRQVRLEILQLLLRLRADSSNRLFITNNVDISGLATLLTRFKKAPGLVEEPRSPPHASVISSVREIPEQDRGRPRRPQESPDRSNGEAKSRSISRLGRNSSRERQLNGSDTSNCLWTVPEKLGFDIDDRTLKPSRVGLLTFDFNLDWSESWSGSNDSFPEYDAAMLKRPNTAAPILPVSEYLKILIKLLEEDSDWDLIAYILCLLPLQLSCKHFACGPRASQQVKRLRHLLCESLEKGNLAPNTILPAGAKRADLPQIAYQTLSTLIAYKTLFTKAQQDEMVESFINGLTQRDIAKPCIHALAMCCHELQPSMTRFISTCLASLLKILSSAQMAVHILELIASIGQIPALFSSFTEEDYRTVFGICLQYISLHNDHLADEHMSTSATSILSRREELNFAFSQYVFHLAYYVVDLWYMSLKLANRRKHVSFIVKKLVQANEVRGELDEPSEVCIDMIARYAYADIGPHSGKSWFKDIVDEAISAYPGSPPVLESQTWVRGHALITIETFSFCGWAEITVRRPSSTVRMLLEVEDTVPDSTTHIRQRILSKVESRHRDPMSPSSPQILSVAEVGERFGIHLKPSEQHDAQSHSKASTTTNEGAFHPSFEPPFFTLQVSGFPEFHTDPPVLVPKEDRFQRSVKLLDNVPVVDFHKVAVLYVGGDDETEVDILSNTHGSKDYVQFLSGLGQLIRLKNNTRYYLGGLDKEMDVDGKWAYIWSNRVSQIVYHVATLMPTDLARDAQCTGKKRHIGNDFVKVIFNDSGRPFSSDTIPGQFNFVNIIIEPQTPAGKSWSAYGMSSNGNFFKVSMQNRLDMPEIGPLGVFKMVSAACLPEFVRHLALHANVFAQVFLESVGVDGRQDNARPKTEFVSNWRRRLQQIKQLKNRLVQAKEGEQSKSGKSSIDLETLIKHVDFVPWTT